MVQGEDALIRVEQTHLATPGRLDQNPAAVYLAGLAAGSRRTMRQALETIAGLLTKGQAGALTLPWHELRFQHTSAIRSRLADEYAPSTANKMLSALRGVLAAAWQLGQMSAEDYHLAASIKSVTGETMPAGRAVTQGELAALMRACEQDPLAAGPRDAAIIGVLYTCGLRRKELVSLDLADYDREANALKVRGKRHKERRAYPANGAERAIADWLQIRGDAPGPLFTAIARGGHVQDRRLTTQAVYHILNKRAEEAGVKQLSPHDLRRTFVGDLLDAGADIATVQKLAGHTNVQTTARYDRRPEEAKRKAAEKPSLPYRPRSRD